MARLLSRLSIICLLMAAPVASGAEWLRGDLRGRQQVWGVRGGLQFALPSAARGPRGLLHLSYPTLPDGGYDVINFVAVEPVVHGRRGLSELEHSRLDNVAGKRFWVEADEPAGKLVRLGDGVEQLSVAFHIEPFDNGAHLRLTVEQRSDRPDEMAMSLQMEPGGAPVEQGILTATMGNKARARQLWLRDGMVTSHSLYGDYKAPDFTSHTVYPLGRLPITKDGDVRVAVTTDERRPADVRPFPGTNRWYYGGRPVTQYWRMPRDTWSEDLCAAVNARYTYWRTRTPIPGGIAFENFELRDRFRDGQRFIFAVTKRTPAELGLYPATATAPTDGR